MADAYSILEVSRTAASADIKKAYQRAALRYHPDRHSEATKAVATERFKSIGEAFAILSDPSRRRQYDASLNASSNAGGRATPSASRQRRPSMSRASTPGPPGSAPSAPPRMSSFAGQVDPFRVFSHAWGGKEAAEVFADEDRAQRRQSAGELPNPDRQRRTSLLARPPSRTGGANGPATSGNPTPVRPSSAFQPRSNGTRPGPTRDADFSRQSIYADDDDDLPVGFSRTTVRTFKEANGSVHFERIHKERTLDEFGNVRDRFRHTRAGVVMDPEPVGPRGSRPPHDSARSPPARSSTPMNPPYGSPPPPYAPARERRGSFSGGRPPFSATAPPPPPPMNTRPRRDSFVAGRPASRAGPR